MNASSTDGSWPKNHLGLINHHVFGLWVECLRQSLSSIEFSDDLVFTAPEDSAGNGSCILREDGVESHAATSEGSLLCWQDLDVTSNSGPGADCTVP